LRQVPFDFWAVTGNLPGENKPTGKFADIVTVTQDAAE
jgi:hypothetical protein